MVAFEDNSLYIELEDRYNYYKLEMGKEHHQGV